MSNEELVPVTRVTIEYAGRVHEIPKCWISVQPTGEVGIWISPKHDAPLLRLPLAQVQIEWPQLEVTM